VSFEGTAIGAAVTDDVIFTNAGAEPLHFTGATLPGAPFSSDDIPAVGHELAPGASVSVNITIKPTASGEYIDALTLDSDADGSATVNLSGTSGTSGQLAVTPLHLNYGNHDIGTTSNQSFAVSNIGGTPITITQVEASIPERISRRHHIGGRDHHPAWASGDRDGGVRSDCARDFERSMGPQRVRGVDGDRCDLHGRRCGKPDRAGVASAVGGGLVVVGWGGDVGVDVGVESLCRQSGWFWCEASGGGDGWFECWL
jgi:hypothetical protein